MTDVKYSKILNEITRTINRCTGTTDWHDKTVGLMAIVEGMILVMQRQEDRIDELVRTIENLELMH